MLQSAIHSLSTLLRLRNDPFERYSLSLSDFQILVGKVNENWREVTRSGQSSLHLLDKFTLSVRIQKYVCVCVCVCDIERDRETCLFFFFPFTEC